MNLNQLKQAAKNVTSKVTQSAALVGTAGLALVSNAHAAMDTAGIVSAITDAATAIGVVGGAVLLAYVGMKAFKLVRGAL